MIVLGLLVLLAVGGRPTVKTHVGHVLMKLGVRDRVVQLIVFAYERGLVEPGQP